MLLPFSTFLPVVLTMTLASQPPTKVAEASGSASTSKPPVVVPDVKPDQDLETLKRQEEEKKEAIEELMKAIKALEFKSMNLSLGQKRLIAEAAYKVGKEQNLDPRFLIALSRMESDFTGKPQISPTCYLRGRTCQADCGITQHAIWGRAKYVLRLCKKLTKDPEATMRHSAKEINRHIVWCKARKSRWHKPFMRCVLNRYNSGHNYYTDRKCKKKYSWCAIGCPKWGWWKDAVTKEEHLYRKTAYHACRAGCRKVTRKCRSRASYWRKLLCFYYGAKTLTPMVRSCRYCHALKHIPWYYKRTNLTYKTPLSLSF